MRSACPQLVVGRRAIDVARRVTSSEIAPLAGV